MVLKQNPHARDLCLQNTGANVIPKQRRFQTWVIISGFLPWLWLESLHGCCSSQTLSRSLQQQVLLMCLELHFRHVKQEQRNTREAEQRARTFHTSHQTSHREKGPAPLLNSLRCSQQQSTSSSKSRGKILGGLRAPWKS